MKKTLKCYFVFLFFFLTFSVFGLENNARKVTPEMVREFMESPFQNKVWGKQLGLISKERTSVAKVNPISKIPMQDGKLAYGFLVYDDIIEESGLASFDVSNPANVSLLFPNDKSACAGAYANGKYYVYTMTVTMFGSRPDKFVSVDLNTGAVSEIADYTYMSTQYQDMSYDYSTNTMFVIALDNTTPVLGKVDLVSGAYTKVAKMSEPLATLAADYSGMLYGINAEGYLCAVDKSSGVVAKIGDTGFVPRYLQSMEFDHTDGTLYWAACDMQGKSMFMRINVSNGEAAQIGTLGGNSEVVGLYIPFTLPDEGSPAAPTEMSVLSGENGSTTASVSWTNPSKTLKGDVLSDISKIEIYRNGLLVHTVNSPVAGARENWTDANAINGFNIYKVLAINGKGAGMPVSSMKFVGRDIPAAVTDIVLTKDGVNTGKLSWKAPVVGLNGGWIDVNSLKYNITRYPDEVAVAVNVPGNEYTDNTISTLKQYYYTIEAVNEDGKGGIGISNVVMLGPSLSVPYTCSFANNDEISLWTVIDANKDTYPWEFNTGTSSMFYDIVVTGAEYWAAISDADDWLISSPITLEKGIPYKLTFDMIAYKGFPEILNITMGKGNTVDDQTIKLGTITTASISDLEHFILIIPEVESGDYNIGFEIVTPTGIGQFCQLTNVAVTVNTAGAVNGKITESGNAVESARVVFLQGDNIVAEAMSDEDGNFSVPYIEAGTYNYQVEKLGYHLINKEVTIAEKEALDLNIEMTKLAVYKVSGQIIDVRGEAVDGAKIVLSSYHSYIGHSSSDGTFEIPDVYEAAGYTMTVSKARLESFSHTIDITGDYSCGTISMKDKITAPVWALAEVQDQKVNITWEVPYSDYEFRYDDGTVTGQVGLSKGVTVNTIIGSIHKTPAVLSEVSWFTTSERRNKLVNVFIIDLDKNGKPTSKVLYSAMDVPNTPMEWCNHVLPDAVDAPNGFMIALSVAGYLSIGIDTGTDAEYPFVTNTHCFSIDYTTGEYDYIENSNVTGNLMIRAKGTPKEENAVHMKFAKEILPEYGLMPKSQNGISLEKGVLSAPVMTRMPSAKSDVLSSVVYNVWKLKEGEEENPELWELLTPSPVKERYLVDNSWGTTNQGVYKYAVRAVYTGNLSSEATYSNTVAKDMLTSVCINTSVNTGLSAEGAIVTLVHKDNKHIYTASVNTDNKVLFDGVWKGIYDIKIELEGYEIFIKNDVDFSSAASYNSDVYELKEIITPPYDLSIQETGEPSERLFSWNKNAGLFEDFEGHTDYAVNSAGDLGWSYIDGDEGRTFGFGGIEFPGMLEPMAYIVFNPSATHEELERTMPAHSGVKFLASFVSRTGANDDYLISPELNFKKDFIISFYAQTYSDDDGLETFRVGYSLTGKAAEDFIWLTNDVEVPVGAWTQFRYDIPAEAKYVTINCTSKNRFIFMVDDIYIGLDIPGRNAPARVPAIPVEYEVYLNGKMITTTQETEYKFTELVNGTYQAGVRSVYSSAKSEMETIDFVVSTLGMESPLENNITLYPNPVKNRLHIEGIYDQAEILSITGTSLGVYDISQPVINVENLDEGVYLLKITHKGGIALHKFVVRK